MRPGLFRTLFIVCLPLCWFAGAQGAGAGVAPPVQMLVPGFKVRELPLRIGNLNNLVFAPDGRLFALAYDGNVFQLEDSDGDGLEDRARQFYKNERNEIPASIGMAWGPGGLYIASRGRVLHLRDRGGGTGELQTVTSGWDPPTKAAGSSLDAVGIVADADGNLYFGLGCDAWSEAYRVDPGTGRSDYNLYSERGTILKLSADWKRRDIICTGMRFPVSLAFNAAGDLFCTDQEGATWLPNGNPFDELLHIEKGRHYGFPPRHPQYLPGVIDEPSVFDYGPQHQSTCGLHFNEPVGGGRKVFGPEWWRGDALVAGESRGKIWRTKLVKTASGYVARNNLLACLGMLTVDAVPTPEGDLLVACHSGAPDWGTGPKGQGKLYRISYEHRDIPQPLLAYAAGPGETRIVFDRPLELARLRELAGHSRLVMGEHVRAGDRFESFAPGYQAVKDQRPVRRSELSVLSAGVTPDHRSLVLLTAARTEAVNYAVTLPELSGTGRSTDERHHEVRQEAGIDLLTDLSGVEAEWRSATGERNWSGWLPHLDLGVGRELTRGSADHEVLFKQLARPGTLRLRAQLDLGLMLRTVVQPGAKLEVPYPPEWVTITLKSPAELEARADARVERVNEHELRVSVESREGYWLPIEIILVAGEGGAQLEVAWHTAEDLRPRALPLRRILLPWATPKTSLPAATGERRIPELSRGDWERGRKLFFGERAACSKCHRMRGQGGGIGPDLSNLVYRDYASVLKDITQPSAAINPEHLAYEVLLKDGETVTGVVVSDQGGRLVLGQVTGVNLEISRSEVREVNASSVSLMPEGLWEAVSEEERRDLMTFLLMGPKDF